MPGGTAAVASGADLEREVAALAIRIGLDVRRQVKVSRPASNQSLGIECKWQGVGGSAEEKIPATIQDIAAWPISGLVVFAGQGFSTNLTSYLHSTGKAVSFEDLEGWPRLFFGLAEPSAGTKDPAV